MEGSSNPKNDLIEEILNTTANYKKASRKLLIEIANNPEFPFSPSIFI